MQERKKPSGRGGAGRGEKVGGSAGGGRDLGRNQKRGVPVVPAAKKGVSALEPCACPECGKTFRTDEAVQTHRHAAHGTAATVVGDMTRCAECGSLVKNSHMATHRRRTHGLL